MHSTGMRRGAAVRRCCLLAAGSLLGAWFFDLPPVTAQQAAPGWQVGPPPGRDGNGVANPPGLQAMTSPYLCTAEARQQMYQPLAQKAGK